MTVVMATQDAQAAARFADRVLVLCEGQVALDGTPAQVFAQVDRLDAWGIDVPQLARLGHRIGQEAVHRFFTQAGLDPRRAGRVLAETGFAESAPASAGTRPTAPCAPDEPRPRSEQTLPGGGEPLIEIRALTHRYSGAGEPALSGVDLEICRGEWLAIVGINGSGKSTLIRHLNGLLKPTEGQVTVEGQDTRAARIGELARVVSYLPQNPGLLLFASTVRREIAYGPRQLGLRGAELEARVSDTLGLMGLADYTEHPPAVLSYGLRRQVALASVLAMHAPVLALDEPATGLDRGSAGRLLDLIAERQDQGTTVVMITHDLRWVARYAQRVAVLSAGQLVACGPTQALLADLDLLAKAGLDPLPVTALAHAMNLSAPLPCTVDELLARDARFAGNARV
jgi:energy-coupling factor transport system ATP-binding protein